MLTYNDGSEIRIGDSVIFERQETAGTVEVVVDSSDQMKAWGVQESGVMLKSAAFGLVFIPQSSILEDPIKLVSRVPQT